MPNLKSSTNRLIDGQLSWSGGVNSNVTRTKVLDFLPDGVQTNQAAWLINATTRRGGIGQRPTCHPLIQNAPWNGFYQGGIMYQPDYTDPILILLIGGYIWRVRVDTDNSVTNLSLLYGEGMPAGIEHAYFSQGEMFAVIQAGDYTTLPLFYDFGTEGIRPEGMRRSNGLVNPGVSDPLNELPAAGPMDFYAQRLWYAYGQAYVGGDITFNKTSGSPAYDYRDSILKLTENPIAYGGDAFSLPTKAGNIRALSHAANLDSSLGESQLHVFTRRAVYTCSAPITRDDWVATTLDAAPLQKVIVDKGGSYSDRCVVPVNGDLFFQSPPNGDIRSVQSSLRYFGQWGNVPLSANERRVIAVNDRELLRGATGINFDNYLLQSALPVATPVGVGHQAIIPLNFDTISTLEERRPPAWEGVWDFSNGPYILQLFEGDFGGRERAFAVVWSLERTQIELWEIRPDLRFENGENRVTRVIELPAYPFGDPFQLKELVGGELWFDKILGTIDVSVQYRPDSYACWIPWERFQKCAAKDCREDVDDPCPDTGYPEDSFCEQDAIPITLPRPPMPPCIANANRPSNWGFQFQMRLIITGWARLRGALLYAEPRGEAPYNGITCRTPSSTL